ncbi:MAG TPA: hypothetical protein VIY30_02750 [Burkholderiaceae bacterium]
MTGRLRIRVAGTNVQQFQNNSLKLKLENAAPIELDHSGRCPEPGFQARNQAFEPASVAFEFTGKVGEFIERQYTPEPEVRTTLRLELIKRNP